MSQELQTVVDAAWEKRDGISSTTKGPVRDAVEAAIAGLDDGTYRTAEKFGNEWVVNQWLKKAVLLSFRLYDSVPMDGGASFPGMGGAPWFDKVPLKTTGWDAARFAKAGFRAVPGSIVRRGSYVAPSAPMSTQAPWSTPGQRWARAPRSARTAISRAASASAASWNPCRPTQ